ncbi:MAG TPA: helix-turn-helix domain-containing protein [Verrucomicrobiae bacterium]|nr:helix-turn-helix domain-containing protein [Verrucomicrobiae bacterium]
MNQTQGINEDTARRLRALRLRAHLSMRELARRADVAVSYVSNLESGKVSATIATLRKLLLALDSDLGPFFSESHRAPDGLVFRRSQMRSANDGGRSYTFVLPSRKDIRFEMLDEELFAGEKPEFELQQGDLAGYVISGELILEIKGEPEPHRLQAGDAFYVIAGRWARGWCGKGDSVRLITSELLSLKKPNTGVQQRAARTKASKQTAL